MQITEGDSSVSFQPGPASRFKWQASGLNPCPRCKELDGEVRTLDAWESSVMPGLHKHCRCKLVCIEAVDSGWIFTDQFPYIGAAHFNIDGSISHDPGAPGPDGNADPLIPASEGSQDIVPPPPPHGPNSSPNPDLPEPYHAPPPNTYNNQNG